MAASRSMRLIETALRCYPERWRIRYGEEATEIARLLMRDGTPAWSIVWSYLRGAASARLRAQPRRRLGAAAGALLAAACSLGVSLALLSPSVPASATSVARHHATSASDAHACGNPRSSAAMPIRAAVKKPADRYAASRHGQHC